MTHQQDGAVLGGLADGGVDGVEGGVQCEGFVEAGAVPGQVQAAGADARLLQVGDVATPDADAFITQVQRLKIGQSVTLTYLRGAQQRQTTLTLAARRSVPDLDDSPRAGPC